MPTKMMPSPVERQLARRQVRLMLPAPYENCSILAAMTQSPRTWRDLYSEDEAAVRGALVQFVIEHDIPPLPGEPPYPPASDPAFWDEVPTDVAIAIIREVKQNMGRLDPNPAAR